MITFRELRLWRRAARSPIWLRHCGRLRLLFFRALLQLCLRKLAGCFLLFFVKSLDFCAFALSLRCTVQLIVKASELNVCVAEIGRLLDYLLEQADCFAGVTLARVEKCHLVES